MLVVEIKLVPGGFQSLRRTIGTLRIGNISNLADVSNYQIDVTEAANPLTGTPARTAVCLLEGHDRRQSIWKIIGAASMAIEHADWSEL